MKIIKDSEIFLTSKSIMEKENFCSVFELNSNIKHIVALTYSGDVFVINTDST